MTALLGFSDTCFVDPLPPAPRRSLRDAVAIYLDRRMLAILLMGFASGLPLLLTTSTLSYWLAKRGVDKTSIGIFALVGLPYSLKFVWAPALDFVRVPWLGGWLGRRRAWTLVAQALLVLAILGMGATDPARDPLATALLALRRGVLFRDAGRRDRRLSHRGVARARAGRRRRGDPERLPASA